MHDKHQIIEEPCEVKVSRTVLKTSGVGDNLAEFNGCKTVSDCNPCMMPESPVFKTGKWLKPSHSLATPEAECGLHKVSVQSLLPSANLP